VINSGRILGNFRWETIDIKENAANYQDFVLLDVAGGYWKIRGRRFHASLTPR
jgi:hypothetical protein